jgi:hypothetical protein
MLIVRRRSEPTPRACQHSSPLMISDRRSLRCSTTRCAAITETDVVLGEELVELVRQVDAVRPGFARKLFQLVRPEELAFLREAAAAIDAARSGHGH